MPPQKRPEELIPANDTLLVKSSDLLFMRDNFISGLSHLESGVHELKRAYITQFNTLLPEGHAGRLTLPFFAPTAVPMGPVPAGVPAPMPANPQMTGEANTKRKRKPHDKSAPKRALTSYFLFMQQKKPEIKAEHADWSAQQISEESEKLWATITEKERADYEYMYQVDLARYYKQKECYESGEPIPEISADEARRLYQEHLKKGVPFKGRKGKKVDRPVNIPPEDRTGGQPSSSEEEEDVDVDEEEEEEIEEPAPPPKKQRQKTAPAPVEPPKSPEKKTKKGGRKSEVLAVEPEAVASPPKTKKSKKAGRKSKGGEE